MSFLNLNHLQINFGVDQFAIQDFSLEVAHGEFVVLLGPSGSGKTTILRMIAGLERPAKGKIVLGGKDISHLPPHQRNLTMVFQNYPTYPHLSVRGNLEFPLRCKNISKAKRKEQIHQVAESLGLNELLGRKPGDLSGGERQRVALGKGLIQQPEVFLLDEPLSHLDAQLRVKLRQELREILKARKQTVLYVTHDQEEALALADRLVILRKGTLEQVDTPKNIFQNPATSFVAGFIGNPGMNLLPCISKREGDQILISGDWFRFQLDSGNINPESYSEIIVGIRPFKIKVGDEEKVKGKGIVESIQLRGENQLVMLSPISGKSETEKLVIQCGSGENLTPNQQVQFSFSPTEAYYFDPNRSGARIRFIK